MLKELAIIGNVLSNPKNAIPKLVNQLLIVPLQNAMQKSSQQHQKNIMYIFELQKDADDCLKPVIVSGYMQEGKFTEIDTPVFVEDYLSKELKDNFPERLVDTVVSMVAKQFNKENVKIDDVPALIGSLFKIMTDYIIAKQNEKQGNIKYLLRFKTSDCSKGSIIFETCWYDDGKIETMNSIEPKNLYAHFENQATTSEKKK